MQIVKYNNKTPENLPSRLGYRAVPTMLKLFVGSVARFRK